MRWHALRKTRGYPDDKHHFLQYLKTIYRLHNKISRMNVVINTLASSKNQMKLKRIQYQKGQSQKLNSTLQVRTQQHSNNKHPYSKQLNLCEWAAMHNKESNWTHKQRQANPRILRQKERQQPNQWLQEKKHINKCLLRLKQTTKSTSNPKAVFFWKRHKRRQARPSP